MDVRKDDLFDCIRQMPAHFSSYQVLSGEIGEFISVARQADQDWFIGSLTNRDPRKLLIEFDFLDEDIRYEAVIYEDTKNTHFLTNKEEYQIRKVADISNKSQLTIELAPGGGNAIWLKAQ